jgi:hypothetical protein
MVFSVRATARVGNGELDEGSGAGTVLEGFEGSSGPNGGVWNASYRSLSGLEGRRCIEAGVGVKGLFKTPTDVSETGTSASTL